MKAKSRRFAAVDVLYLALAVLPIAVGIIIKILTASPSGEIEIAGAMVYFTLDAPIMDIVITESQVNSVLVILSITGICLYMTHGLSPSPTLKRQMAAEWIVEQCTRLVKENMGSYFSSFAPFICAMLGLSAFSSFLSLVGLFPPTSDINVVGGWAILVFFLITYYKMKCGPLRYLKSFTEPVPFLTPLNVISEVATPVSMAFRHYGNILSGTVISVLIASGLGGLSQRVFGSLPGVLGDIPFLRVGIPAVLSVYFDVFSGALQAFIFAMLTMLYVSSGFPLEEYEKRQAKRKNKKEKNNKSTKKSEVKNNG